MQQAEPLILNIETATRICSVALSKGENLLSLRESNEDRSHGALLTVFMKEVLEETGTDPGSIDAIAVSKGPGSYTGLRIGVSATKGFAYARNIPVIGIVTLKSLTIAAMEQAGVREFIKAHDDLLFCPMIDARRMEVFTAIYDLDLNEINPVNAKIIDEDSFREILDEKPVMFFGDGAEKVKEVLKHDNAHFQEHIFPSAKFMIPLSIKAFLKKAFEDTAYFEPFYLKDFIATIPRRKVL